MHIFTVSEFIGHLNEFFAAETIVIEGEVSDFKVNHGKWVFFDLKDEDSKVNCFMTIYQLKGTPLEDGMKVRITGYPKIYAKYGRFSITVQKVELAGEGSLKRAFEMVKAKLEKEGLFDTERKRLLPGFPRAIGLITSKEAAAYTDFMRILNNRWGGMEIHLANVSVQGEEAVPSIVEAFNYFNNNHSELGIEMIVLTRGGGAMDDLVAFNSEDVARAIFSSRVPVICGVGHERDITISDLVADLRVSTPTAAAQTIVPERKEVEFAVQNNLKTIHSCFSGIVDDKDKEISLFVERLYGVLDMRMEKFKYLTDMLSVQVSEFQNSIFALKSRVEQKMNLITRDVEEMNRSLKVELDAKIKILENLDPERILERGYSIVYKNKKIVRGLDEISEDDKVGVRLYKGVFTAKVLEINKE